MVIDLTQRISYSTHAMDNLINALYSKLQKDGRLIQDSTWHDTGIASGSIQVANEEPGVARLIAR